MKFSPTFLFQIIEVYDPPLGFGLARANFFLSFKVGQFESTGNGFNKIMRTGSGFNTVIMYIFPSKQEREILIEATRTCVWLKLDVCSMRVRLTTQQRDTSGLINHQVKYFAMRTALSPFSYVEGMADL